VAFIYQQKIYIMPMPSEMGLEFTPVEVQDMLNHFNGILAIMNAKKVVQLTAKERQGAQSVSEIRFPYTENAIHNLAPTFPNLQPSFLSLADAEKDFSASSDLRSLANVRNEVNDRMIDFAMASEHFAFEYMRQFYHNAQRAQGVNTPGADTVVEALAPLFEGQGERNSEDDEA